MQDLSVEIEKATELFQAGRHTMLLEHCGKLLQLVPRNPQLLNLNGLALHGLKRYRQAIRHFEAAIEVVPGFGFAWCNLGNAMLELGEIEQAISCYRKTIVIAPGLTEAWFSLGLAYLAQGDKEEAEASFLRAIELKPDHGAAHRLLAFCRDYSGGANAAHVAQLRDALADNDLNASARKEMHFALGKVLDDIDDIAGAFEQFAQGNALDHQENPFDRNAFLEFTRHVKSTFESPLQQQAKFSSTTKPILIIGMPRSGTTLVEQVLSCHPEVHTAGESRALTYASMELEHELKSLYPVCMKDAEEELLTRHSVNYMERLLDRTEDQRGFVTDKAPTNFQHLGVANMLVPGIHIVHCRRDPVATGFSIFHNYFPGKLGFSNRLEDIGFYYREYEKLMEFWQSVLSLNIHEVVYEKFVRSPEEETRKLLDFLNLEFNEACLNPENSDRLVRTLSAVQVRQPINADAINKYDRYDKYLAPLREALAG